MAWVSSIVLTAIFLIRIISKLFYYECVHKLLRSPCQNSHCLHGNMSSNTDEHKKNQTQIGDYLHCMETKCIWMYLLFMSSKNTQEYPQSLHKLGQLWKKKSFEVTCKQMFKQPINAENPDSLTHCQQEEMRLDTTFSITR